MLDDYYDDSIDLVESEELNEILDKEDMVYGYITWERWQNILEYYELSDDFIDEYCEELDWEIVSRSQKLTEGMITKYSSDVNWINICQYQKLTNSF
ncbi:hypothetical protein [Haloplasma contractile]|uniref:Uncharacterized protein n=1 Tax=Haloplasma contractile SSD-17B TaxID=1033810 RepID=F7PWW3_9MOLU|nr:hypothetical protein [Haloplasma contractile]ERJ12510.1 hypothetical protein HLPCO_001496 [Haloplasma contractile SSD-17B]